MSGLAALFDRRGVGVDVSIVQTMIGAVPHRGLDGMAVRNWGSLALGHARLVVTPEDRHEQQPLVSPRTGCAIIADVRLDNRSALLGMLGGSKQTNAATGDAELLLCAYEAWGLDAFPRLLGDFAFIIWDPRQQRVICVRDSSGQRPLFYRLSPTELAAASEIQQLFQDPRVPIAPNDEAIRERFIPLNMFRNEKDQAATYFAGVHNVPAGHFLVVDRATTRLERYWSLGSVRELRYRSHDEYAAHFLDLFSDVIATRLRTDRPLGALLSGGLDSSAVVCTAQELYRQGRAIDHGFTTYSSIFDGLECDERNLIEDVRAKYGFRARLVPDNLQSGWLQPAIRGFYESPFQPGGGARAVPLADAITADGIRVVLTGDIADACVRGGRHVFDGLVRRGAWSEFHRHWTAYRRVSEESLKKSLAFGVGIPLLPLSLQRTIRAQYFARKLEGVRPLLLPGWMPEPLRQELAERHVRLVLQEERQRRFGNLTRADEFAHLYPPEVARVPPGWSVEIWRPWADRRLHEFHLSVPPEAKFSPHADTDEDYAASKQLVRKAMRGLLPESIRTRTSQTHFGSVFHNEMSVRWDLYENVFGPKARPLVAERGFVDRERFWNRLQEMRHEGKPRVDLMYVLGVLGLESWLLTFEQPRSQRVTVPNRWLPAGTEHRERDAVEYRSAARVAEAA